MAATHYEDTLTNLLGELHDAASVSSGSGNSSPNSQIDTKIFATVLVDFVSNKNYLSSANTTILQSFLDKYRQNQALVSILTRDITEDDNLESCVQDLKCFVYKESAAFPLFIVQIENVIREFESYVQRYRNKEFMRKFRNVFESFAFAYLEDDAQVQKPPRDDQPDFLFVLTYEPIMDMDASSYDKLVDCINKLSDYILDLSKQCTYDMAYVHSYIEKFQTYVEDTYLNPMYLEDLQ